MKNLLYQFIVFGFAAAFVGPLAFGSHGSAAEPVRSSGGPTAHEAYQQLLSTKFFAFGGVGFAGTTSEGERAFHAIAASTNALELFTAVLAKGNTQSRLYALCGIRRLAPEKFDALAKPIVIANPKVSTMAGCVGRDDRASNVVAHIAGGLYDFYIGGTKTDQRSNLSVQRSSCNPGLSWAGSLYWVVRPLREHHVAIQSETKSARADNAPRGDFI